MSIQNDVEKLYRSDLEKQRQKQKKKKKKNKKRIFRTAQSLAEKRLQSGNFSEKMG